MAKRLRPNVRINVLELQEPDRLESLDDIDLRTRRALGLISHINDALTDDYSEEPSLNFDRVCECIDDINQWGELLIAQGLDGGKVVGALQATFNEPNNSYDIDHLVVDPTRRNAGIGKELMAVADQHARERSLGTVSLKALQESISFYDKLGFSIDPRNGGKIEFHTRMYKPLVIQ